VKTGRIRSDGMTSYALFQDTQSVQLASLVPKLHLGMPVYCEALLRAFQVAGIGPMPGSYGVTPQKASTIRGEHCSPRPGVGPTPATD
jgi:hypothetical protein